MKLWFIVAAAVLAAGCAQANGLTSSGPPEGQANSTVATSATTASARSEPGTLPAPVRALVTKGLAVDGSLDAPKGFRGYLGKAGRGLQGRQRQDTGGTAHSGFTKNESHLRAVRIRCLPV